MKSTLLQLSSHKLITVFFVAAFFTSCFFAGAALYDFLPKGESDREQGAEFLRADSDLSLGKISVSMQQDIEKSGTTVFTKDQVFIPKNIAPKVEIYISNISFDQKQKTYKPTDTMTGKIELYYPGDTPVSGVQGFLYLGSDFNERGFPGQKLAQISLGKIDFQSNEKKSIPFDFTLPNLSLESFNIYGEFLSASGSQVGFYNSPEMFTLTGDKDVLGIGDAYIRSTNIEKNYFLGQGPGVGPGTPNTGLQLVIKLDKDVSELPVKIDIYEDSITSEPIESKEMNLEKEGDYFIYNVPSDKKPGVYVAQVSPQSEGALPINFRWIIGGPSAQIRTFLVENDNAMLALFGVPHPATYGATIDSSTPNYPATIKLDFRGKTFWEDSVSLMGYNKTLTIPLENVSFLWMGGVMTAQVISSTDGLLATETVTVQQHKYLYLVLSLTCLIFISLILFYQSWRRKVLTNLVFVFVCGVFSLLFLPQDVAALVGSYGETYAGTNEDGVCASEGYPYPTLSLSHPHHLQYLACNQQFHIVGQMTFGACENTGILPSSLEYRYINGNTGAATAWTLLSPAYSSGEAGGGHSWNPIYYQVNEILTAPADIANYNAIEFYIDHSGAGGCTSSVKYYQPIAGVCCTGGIPQNADKCPNTEANTNNQPVLSCTGARACEYDCIGGYIPDSPNSIDCRLPICLANGGIGANTNNVGPANSYVLSGSELPASLTLTQDYYMTLRWSIGATQYTVAEIDRTSTGAGCEYTCNAGYIPDGASSCRLPVCLPNSAIGVTANNVYPGNASPISALELPSSLTLVRDYTSTLIADPNRRTELNTAAGCEYTCNDGFKIGPKTATAESNSAGTFAKITHGGGGYTTAPTVQVTGGSCTTRPTAVATINASGSVDSLTLTGAVNCSAAPALTLSAPTDTTSRCIATQCLGFAKPLEAIYCSGDTTLAGHDDELNTRRADSSGCTSNAKCEWYCPAATPFYCESANTCVTSQNECGQTNTCKTSAPSEIKKELDVPFIQCDAINGTDLYFRYKIEKTGGTASDTYISPLFTVGTSVKHPTTFYTGTYKVTCLYGSAANTNATLPDYGMTAGTCTKTMTANDTANGCSRIYPYRGSTLSDELTSASAFDASFRCGSREVVTNTADTKAYRLQVATSDPSFLAYDRNITDLFAGLAIGPVSTQTQSYNFNTGADITCAAKVGDGYSTNPSCQARACVGGACATPQSFIVVPSEEVTCTNQDSISYDVGCNPSSPDYTECLQWMYQDNTNTTNINGVETYNRNAKIKVNNVEQDIYFTCKIETPPGALGPVKTCSIQLPTGGTPVTIFAGDATTTNNTTNYSFQTTAYTLRKDTGKPTGTIAYYTNYSNGVTLSPDQYEYWQKQPITAVITCTDKAATSATGEPTTAGETDGSGCACSQTLTTNNATPTAAEQLEIDQWSLGIPSSNTNIGPDVMTYSRVIANMNNATTTPPAVKVQDSASNKSTQSFQPDFGIDSTAPKLVATKTGNSVTLAFTDNHVGASGFWKPLSAFNETLPAGVSRGATAGDNAILYRIGPKTNLAALEFGADCSPLPVKNTNYYKYKEVPAAPGTQTLTLNSFDVNNNIVAYCIQDNAGNINRGYYPNNLMGCFASTAMPTIPTLSPSTLTSHYAPLLKTKFASTTLTNNEKYGYSFSENPTNASCFRGILSNNITTLVTNQLNPRPAGEVTLTNWTTQLSTIKNTTTPNTNGYYYYTFSANTNNTVTVTPPTGTGTKNVIVDGGNIQINSNIEYTGSGKTLLLIARKNNAGQGGNIYINPTVTRIDAIIIADGGTLMNGTTTSGVTTTKNWITHPSDLTNRLTINGRLYSYNTRGGSITPQASGTDFDPIAGNIGKYFDTNSTNATQLITTASPTQAATYDLERLRVMLSDGNSQCTTQVNYQAFTVASLPALLTRPASYQGGNCSF